MKTRLILALVVITSLCAFAAQSTVTGLLTDDMCAKKHMMPGKSDAECIRACVKHGAKYVVVVDGKPIELKGNQEQFSALAGQTVKVTGELANNVIAVSAIEAAK